VTNRRLLRPSSRRLAMLLLAVAVPPAATLVWLGLQLLQQDRELLTQRDFERRQTAVQAVARALGPTTPRRGRDSPTCEPARCCVSPASTDSAAAGTTRWVRGRTVRALRTFHRNGRGPSDPAFPSLSGLPAPGTGRPRRRDRWA
jgi:hypothetical protein